MICGNRADVISKDNWARQKCDELVANTSHFTLTFTERNELLPRKCKQEKDKKYETFALIENTMKRVCFSIYFIVSPFSVLTAILVSGN